MPEFNSKPRLTTIPDLIERACQTWPDKTFVDFSGETYTYSEVDIRSNRIAHGLIELGVSPGDRVCMMCDNVPDFVFFWFAVNKIGAILVPLNTALKGPMLMEQITDSGARIAFVGSRYLTIIARIVDRLPQLEIILCEAEADDLSSSSRVMSLESIYAKETAVSLPVAPRNLAAIHYTSGTTGPSKGGMWEHGFLCYMGEQKVWHSGISQDDVIWTPCPLFHGSGLTTVVAALAAGATISSYTRFSVTNFWPEIERSRATVVGMLSIMLSLIPSAGQTEVSKRCFGQIRVLYGGPLDGTLQKQWRELFGVKFPFSPGFGMTEASLITIARFDDPDAPEGSCGRRFPDFDVRIVDDVGNECAPDQPGEIVARPERPGIMFSGYWARPAATLAVFRDLWLHTGDIGKIDENGYLYFLDRKKDYLRRGGENISSFEVERAFSDHPDVLEVAAHAVLADLGEDDLKVTLVLRENSSLSEEELFKWVYDQLPRFALPRYIEFRSELPRTASGKVQKHVLRAEGATARTWDSGSTIPGRRSTETFTEAG